VALGFVASVINDLRVVVVLKLHLMSEIFTSDSNSGDFEQEALSICRISNTEVTLRNL